MDPPTLNSTPPAKRQRSALTVDNDDTPVQAGPVAKLLCVPLSIIFQLQPQIVSSSAATPSKTKEKPLLSRAEAQAFLQVHYAAQDMDALIATAEAAFRQKLKYREFEQSICRVDHPLARPLLPLLRQDPYECLKSVPDELNHTILPNLERVAVSLQQFAVMNATTADNLADINGMEILAEGKNKLSELQLEVSRRIAALLAHQITEETNWCSMEEYCQRLFPNQVVTLVEVEDQVNETPAKLPDAQDVVQQVVVNDSSPTTRSMVRGDGDQSTMNDTLNEKNTSDSVVNEKTVTFNEEVLAAPEDDRVDQESSSPLPEKDGEPAPDSEADKTHEIVLENETGIALLHQAVQAQVPMDPNSVDRSETNNKDDLAGIDKENTQSQHSQNDASIHPTLLIYGSQVSHASDRSLTCRPGAETQTAAALLSYFAIPRSNDGSDAMSP